MTPEDAFREALRADPDADAKRLAKRLHLSGRAARRVVAELEAEGVVRRRRGRHVAVAVAALALGGGLAWRALGPDAAPQDSGKPAARSPAAQVAERELYAATDARDPSRVDAALRQLEDEDEPLRLAALRYLVGIGASGHRPALLARLDDPSERVRLAALQLVGQVPGPAVDERLAGVVVGAKRPLGERTVAAASLGRRKVEAPGDLARRLLPALLDTSLTVRQETARLLGTLTARTVTVDAQDALGLHAAWRTALGAE